MALEISDFHKKLIGYNDLLCEYSHSFNLELKENSEMWNCLGKPHVWELVEISEDMLSYAFLDTAHACMLLIHINIIVGVARSSLKLITTPDVIMMDKEFYNLPKYLWK